ncbi:unnamed protein product [Acanthoscelides obtectus]|uniref:Uncharacterized protein n=1 Tax=Acanthoscelides obtectus TaxID=200917 RepID=A0A9P0LW26_ACAOB|nr:unnamed protein product [Acanthoscelides obtectus]CAK1653542.1 hypothetical protein AOBTE_LOCUS18283 [Acanthoscelides obtectus]
MPNRRKSCDRDQMISAIFAGREGRMGTKGVQKSITYLKRC